MSDARQIARRIVDDVLVEHAAAGGPTAETARAVLQARHRQRWEAIHGGFRRIGERLRNVMDLYGQMARGFSEGIRSTDEQ